MNEILQQRIEKAARHYLLNEHKSPLNEILHQCDLNTEMQYHRDIESAYIAGTTFALQNQWISVEEALPEIKEHFVSEDVICKYSNDTMGFSRLKENLFGQKWFEYEDENSHVTHWMPIPELKGGEE